MKIILQYLFCISMLTSFLTACHLFKTEEEQYLKSQSIKPITVPSNLSSSSIEDYYPIPNDVSSSDQQSKPINLAPPE